MLRVPLLSIPKYNWLAGSLGQSSFENTLRLRIYLSFTFTEKNALLYISHVIEAEHSEESDLQVFESHTALLMSFFFNLENI